MKILGRDDILGADDLKVEEVDVKQWGGIVRVRTMTGAERDELEISIGPDKNFANLRARVLALTIVDESGNRLFTKDDIEALGKKSGKAVDKVFEVARKLNALSDTDVDELLKKSDPSPPDNFISH